VAIMKYGGIMASIVKINGGMAIMAASMAA
jgi:hypothetical protein